MNHRLKFRLIDGYVHLTEVWCPADHGGTCDQREVEESYDRGVPDCWPWKDDLQVDGHADAVAHQDGCDDCTAYANNDHVETGRCWVKENLDENVSMSDGWQDCLKGDIDLPWVAVTIDSCGPDGNDPVMVHVIAEVTKW